MKARHLVARRWFNEWTGNTYHSVRIIVDGEEVFHCPYAYGYDQQYEQTAADWLEKNGFLKLEHYDNGGGQTLWQYAQNKGIVYTRNVTDVLRKKDL